MITIKEIIKVAGRGDVFVWERTPEDIAFTVPLTIGQGIILNHKDDYYMGNIAGIEKSKKLLSPPIESNTIGIVLRKGYSWLKPDSLEKENQELLQENKPSIKKKANVL